MPRRYDSTDAKRRILAACAQLFLKKGYTNTTVAEVIKEANVSSSSFQNIFHAKDGVLSEFVDIMFDRQFSKVKEFADSFPSPAYVYAIETALQLALTEMAENLRDIYVEAYTYPPTQELICRRTTLELMHAFEPYLPDLAECDFYEMDVGTSGMMRSYMARRCDHYFTLERKVRRFLEMSLSVYHVPEEEKAQILSYVAGIDLRAAAKQAMDALLDSLSGQFEQSQQPANEKEEKK